MSVIRMYVFLFELFLAAICLLFFKEFEAFLNAMFGCGDKIMYSIIGSLLSGAFYLASKMIAQNMKTEYTSLKNSLTTFIESATERFVVLETRVDENCENIRGVVSNVLDIKTSINSIEIDINKINKQMEKKREMEIAKKNFKQELDITWLEYSEAFENDDELKEFSAMLFRRLRDFIVERHKYDFKDMDIESFKSSQQSLLSETQRIGKTFTIDDEFLESFFSFINTINKKYYADCNRNFKSELNSKRKKFENDSLRYILNVLDCVQIVWQDYVNRNPKDSVTKNPEIILSAEDI